MIETREQSYQKAGLFEQIVAFHLHRNATILDAGCGNGEFSITQDFKKEAAKIVGVDVDQQALENNPYLDIAVVSSVENINLDDNYFDIIISRALFEHLRNPQTAIAEFARVLKPGGKAIIQTYNIYSPAMFASAILPLKFRRWLKEKTIEKPEGTYPTYYRFNSKRKIEIITEQTGLTIEEFVRYGEKPDFWKNGFLNRFFVFLDKASDKKMFNFLKPALIVVIKK